MLCQIHSTGENCKRLLCTKWSYRLRHHDGDRWNNCQMLSNMQWKE